MNPNSEIGRFVKDVEAMAPLRQELEKIGASLAALVEFANSKGYNFTLDDAKGLADQAELTDAQLAAVAGGGQGDQSLILLNEKFTLLSNIIQSEHDTAKNAIGNIR